MSGVEVWIRNNCYEDRGNTYLHTPWCRVLLEKLTGLQLVKKFPAFHITRRFITALTSVHHLSLSWTSPIQSIYLHPTSWRSILISTHLRLGLPSGFLPSGFPSESEDGGNTFFSRNWRRLLWFVWMGGGWDWYLQGRVQSQNLLLAVLTLYQGADSP